MARKRISVKNEANYTMEERFNDYIAEKRGLNLSPKTITCYIESFNRFSEIIDPSINIRELTRSDVYSFSNDLLEQGDIKITSINHYLRDIRAFLYWCMDNGYMDSFKVEMLKYQEEPKQTYTKEELKLLLAKPKNSNDFVELRTFTIIQWIIGTGNRISTICNVKINDVDFKNKKIYLRHTKNKKLQEIPLSPSLARIIRDYIKKTNDTENRSEYLFCNVYNEKLTPNAIKQSLRDYNLARGVKKTSAHALRHTFAKEYIATGGDCMKLQRILGHSSLEMTRKYVNLLTEDLQRDFENYSLLDRMSQSNSKEHKMKIRKSA